MSVDYFLPPRLWVGARAVTGGRRPDHDALELVDSRPTTIHEWPDEHSPIVETLGLEPPGGMPDVVRAIRLARPSPEFGETRVDRDPAEAAALGVPERDQQVWWEVVTGRGTRGFARESAWPWEQGPLYYLSPLSLWTPLPGTNRPMRLHLNDEILNPFEPWSRCVYSQPKLDPNLLILDLPDQISRVAVISHPNPRDDGNGNIFWRVTAPGWPNDLEAYTPEVVRVPEQPGYMYRLLPVRDDTKLPIGSRVELAKSSTHKIEDFTGTLAWRLVYRLNPHLIDVLNGSGGFRADAFVMTCPG